MTRSSATGYEKQYTRLVLTCRYPAANESITLTITHQETLEIAFVVVTPRRNNLRLYNEAKADNTPHQSGYPSFNGFFSSNLVFNYHEGRNVLFGDRYS